VGFLANGASVHKTEEGGGGEEEEEEKKEVGAVC
jgi:hypothetical protein